MESNHTQPTGLDAPSAVARSIADERRELASKYLQAQATGLPVAFEPAQAERAGAFLEDALSEAAVLDSRADLNDAHA